MLIETNITDWSVIDTFKINITDIHVFEKKNQYVYQLLYHTNLRFESNHIKIKTCVKIENTSNQDHFSF